MAAKFYRSVLFDSESSSDGSFLIPQPNDVFKYVFSVTMTGTANVFLMWRINGSESKVTASHTLTETGTIYFTGIIPTEHFYINWEGNEGLITVAVVGIINTQTSPIGGVDKRKIYKRRMFLGNNTKRYIKNYPKRRKPTK